MKHAKGCHGGFKRWTGKAEFTDIFPGSGAVGQAWVKFSNQMEMAV